MARLRVTKLPLEGYVRGKLSPQPEIEVSVFIPWLSEYLRTQRKVSVTALGNPLSLHYPVRTHFGIPFLHGDSINMPIYNICTLNKLYKSRAFKLCDCLKQTDFNS